MKYLLSSLIVLVLVLAAGCEKKTEPAQPSGTVSTEKEALEIAVIPKGLAHQFWIFVKQGAEAAAELASLREDARKDRISFREMVAGEGLKLATDSLAYFAHWITPELSPIRYDTRFFLAPAPPCQDALHDDLEVTGHVWISPADALEQNEGGSFPMLPPTIINLMALARFPDVEEALRSPAGEEVAAILPRLSMEDGKLKLLLPDDPGYA